MELIALEQKVKHAIRSSSKAEYWVTMDLIYIAYLYAIICYSIQCPNLEKYKHYKRNAVKIKQRLYEILKGSGISFDHEGSFADLENFQSVVKSNKNVYEFDFEALDVFTIHGLLRISEMYPGEMEYKDPYSNALMFEALRQWCLNCFIHMGFTVFEAAKLDIATFDE
jgi:hypothetical protein